MQAYRLYVYVFVGDYSSTSLLIDWLIDYIVLIVYIVFHTVSINQEWCWEWITNKEIWSDCYLKTEYDFEVFRFLR